MRKHVLLYGLLCGALIALLKLIEYRWLVVDHSVEIYGGIVAAVFAALAWWRFGVYRGGTGWTWGDGGGDG